MLITSIFSYFESFLVVFYVAFYFHLATVCPRATATPPLPAPRAAAPAPEAWAETAPEEVADYLRHTCLRFNTASGRQGGAPYSLSAFLYLAHPPPHHTAEAPGELGIFSGGPAGRPQ